MAQKNEWMLYAGLGLGAYLLYKWYENNQPTVVAPAAPATSTLSQPLSYPSSGVIAPTVNVAADRQFVQQWAAGHNDGRWVAAAQVMTDEDVTPMAYLLRTYFTPDGPGQLGAQAMADQYGNTLPDGYQWLYLTKKYGVS